MCDHCSCRQFRAIAELSTEHEQILEVASALIEGRFDRTMYFELAAHIEEEELELFPLAMFGFDDDDWAVLDATPRFLAPDTELVH